MKQSATAPVKAKVTGFVILVAVTFLSFVKVLTEGGTFLLYAVIGVFAWIFAFRLIPETKGKTLEQIQQHWQAGKHPREMGKEFA